MNSLLRDVHHVHFVGIGGIGMSALARFLLARGYTVSGSDREANNQTESLGALGVDVQLGHAASHVQGADLVVVTSAARPGNPEIIAAQAAGIRIVKRAEVLAAFSNAARGIAVAGTHGKTTTSALISHILTEAGLDPTVLIGGISADLGSNARVGASDLVVTEADEYDASFLRLRPSIAVITNVEPDHLDFYSSEERMQAAFREFASGVTEQLIICVDDPVLPHLISGLDVPVTTYGIAAGMRQARNILDEDGALHFSIDDDPRIFQTPLAGLHNVRNALAAIAVADALGILREETATALAGFRGVVRRCELKGQASDIVVLDDYGHHPTEIRTTLAAIKQRYRRPVRVIFQPHTYSRTRSLLADFGTAFAPADTVYLMDIYAARETDTLGVSGQMLAAEVERHHAAATFTGDAAETTRRVLSEVKPGDVLVTMGAGDVGQLGPILLEGLRQ